MWITIDRNSTTTIMRQIYGKIKELIFNGTLAEGEALPPTRMLAKELEVSRNTVVEAYEQLMAEGFLEGKPGSKTVVADGLVSYPVPITDLSRESICKPTETDNPLIDFRMGSPNVSLFPKKEWAKLYSDIMDNLPDNSFTYDKQEGVWELREALSHYLDRVRGIRCPIKNLMIVSGSTQGLSIIANILYRPNAEVYIEDPTHPGLRNVISQAGYRVTGIFTDDKGIHTDYLIPSQRISFIYVTPSHQYPLGSVIPIQRRLALLQFAADNDCYIVEDDYDSEFRHEGQPIHSLYELNPQKVIYLGSFSNLLAPGLRLGNMLLPDALLSAYLPAKKYADVHTETFSQYTLSAFITNGGLEKYIWKVKKLYARNRKHVIAELNRFFQDGFCIKGHAAGLHLLVHFHYILFTEEIYQELLENGVKVYPVSQYEYQLLGNHQHDILLGYANLTFSEITAGIQILHRVLSNIKF